MNFKIDASVIQEALRVIARLAPPDSGQVTVQSTGKKIYMHSANETSRCSVNVPAEVEGKPATFAIPLTALRDATKGRKSLEVEYSKTMCKIRSGNYKVELTTVDALEVEDTKAEGDKSETVVEFSSEQSSWLKQACAVVALKPTALLSTTMPLAIKLSEKGAFVACYDVNHMAFLNSTEATGDMEFTLPLDVMMSVLDAFGGSPFKMELDQAMVKLGNKLVKVWLSLPQDEANQLSIGDVLNTAKSVKKAEGYSMSLNKNELIGFFDNSRSVATKERSEIKGVVDDGKLKLSVTTVQGTAKTIIKTKCKPCEFAIDFEYLDEAVRKAGESVELKLVTDEFLAVKLATSTVVVSLNQ